MCLNRTKPIVLLTVLRSQYGTHATSAQGVSIEEVVGLEG